MKSIKHLLLIILIFCFSGNIFPQKASPELDKVYGPDPLLFNGKKYDFFLPPGTGGHQFLVSTSPINGGVTIKGIRFEHIKLNYDIYNQELLLSYTDKEGSSSLIQISKAWLESFHLGEMVFENHDFKDGPRFYQVLGSGPLKVFYFWRKNFELDKGFGSENFSFGSAKKISYVFINGTLMPYRNKRGFFAIFEPEKKSAIKSYMRNTRLKLKNADDKSMASLINYISNL